MKSKSRKNLSKICLAQSRSAKAKFAFGQKKILTWANARCGTVFLFCAVCEHVTSVLGMDTNGVFSVQTMVTYIVTREDKT